MNAPAAAYSKTASFFHWLVAIPMVGCIGSVLKCQDKNTPKADKGKWMYRHKSLGLLTGMIVAPRLGYRLLSSRAYKVDKIAGSEAWEVTVGKITHYIMYSFMIAMPATGIAMGYYGGKGLPFFYKTIPGAKEKNGQIAKQSYVLHKQIGTYGKYLVPLHVAGAFQHYFRGQVIFSRVNPFRGPPKH